MKQLGADKFGNCLFLLDDKRIVLRLAKGEKPKTIAQKKGDVIAIKKDPEGHYYFYGQGVGVNKMLVDWGASEHLTLDIHGYDGNKKPFQIRALCEEVQKSAKTFFYKKSGDEQYSVKQNGTNGAQMAEHLPKNTEDGALKFCNKCGKMTRHYSSGGRIGRCMEHEVQQETKKQKEAREKREREQKNPRLFDVDPEDDV